MTGGDGGSFEDGGNLLPILKRYTGYGRIDFDLTQDIKLFGDYLQSRTETRSDLTANYDNGTLTINADNAYLPAALRSAMAAANMRSFALGRQQLEDGTAFFSTRTTMRRGVIGVEGRSEEHTSELQSLMRISYAVFCLKNTKSKINRS